MLSYVTAAKTQRPYYARSETGTGVRTMTEPGFAAAVSTRFDPVLARRGLPYAARANGVMSPGEPAFRNPDSVLSHCDGVHAVAESESTALAMQSRALENAAVLVCTRGTS